MSTPENLITPEECAEEVKLMARRTALLFYYFASTLLEELGEEDPLLHKFISAMTYYDSIYSFMDNFVEKGKIIEEFNPELMRRILTSSE